MFVGYIFETSDALKQILCRKSMMKKKNEIKDFLWKKIAAVISWQLHWNEKLSLFFLMLGLLSLFLL